MIVATAKACRGGVPMWARGLSSLKNWAEVVEFEHGVLAMPDTVQDLQDVVRNAERLRVVGSSHSFSSMAAPVKGGTLLATAMLRNVLDLDVEAMTVAVEGGATVGDVVRFLAPREAALPNVPSLPHVSIAGCIATGTHGSGLGLGNLATQVAELDFVLADGRVRTYTRGDDGFEDVVVHLGRLGPVTRIVLDIVPQFEVFESVYKDVPMDALLDNFDALNKNCDSMSTFLNFHSRTADAVWIRHFETAPELGDDLFGGRKCDGPLMFYESGLPVNAHQRSGPSHDMLSFFMDGTQDVGMPNRCIHTEFFVDFADAVPALRAVDEVARLWLGWNSWDEKDPATAGIVLMSELRTVKGDSLTMSPHRGRDTLCIHFTMGPYPEPVMRCVSELQAALEPFSPRAHVGKWFVPDQVAFRRSYGSEHLQRFAGKVLEHDPHGKFRTAFDDSLGLP